MAKEEQIKTSIDLTGEKEYRAACTNINSSLREIGSEMKLVTAEFSDNASSTAALTKKQEVLQKQLAEQAKKAEAAETALKKMREAGIEPTDPAFQKDVYKRQVEGFATTFDKPYVMYEYDGIKYCEVIDRNALAEADLTDVIMQFDHSGMVFARNKMAKNKPPSLLLEPQESGLFIAANLSLTDDAKRLYSNIDAGLIHKMSWAFTVSELSLIHI